MSRFGGYEDNEFLSEFYDVSNQDLKDVDFLVDYARKANGRTLELGCGTGRVLIPTALAGYEITGLDMSPFMLRKCREKINKQSKSVQERIALIPGNMVDFSIDETFSLVTIPFRTFQHLISTKEQKGCLRSIYEHLRPRGRLILDLFHPFLPRLYEPNYLDEMEDFSGRKLPDGREVSRTHRMRSVHHNQQYLEIENIYYVSSPDGRKERYIQSFPFRYFFRYEVEHLLELSGFKVLELFGDFDRSKLSSDSPEMMFVAEKK